jgi:hypothetical protein
MKAYNHLRPAAIAALAITLVLAGSCSEQPIVPTPTPAPKPAPTPAPTPTPPPPLPKPDIDWRTAPATPGDWQWSNSGGKSVARFAGGQFVLSCDPSAGKVTLRRSGAASGQVAMTIQTSSTRRPVTGSAQPGPPPAIAVIFAANDPLLDAMAFSRGRFAVETAGKPTLYVPSWPEVSRVIEDCR